MLSVGKLLGIDMGNSVFLALRALQVARTSVSLYSSWEVRQEVVYLDTQGMITLECVRTEFGVGGTGGGEQVRGVEKGTVFRDLSEA